MAPFSAWLPARPNLDFDLTVKIVGSSASGLIDELASITQALSLHGCQVMAQNGRLNIGSGHSVLSLRIASRPFYSMGDGCDVIVYLNRGPLEFRQFGLQPGSVLVWEPPEQLPLHPLLPDGIIAYPVPLRELNARDSQDTGGKGFVAMGVLAYLLGFSEEARRICLKSLRSSHLFDSGYQFASRSLIKHDIYSLPLAARGDAQPGHVVQVTLDGHLGVQRHSLRQVADLPARLQRIEEYVVAGDSGRAGSWGHEAGQDAHGGRLARAVGPQKAHDFTLSNVEAKVPESGEVSVLFGDMFYVNHR